MSVPKCFISYSWDSEEHKKWVRKIGRKLQENGVHTYLDQWDVHPGKDILQYMEESIRDSDYIIMVCTPKYAEKGDKRKGGVGYEYSIITVELFEKIANPGKFIPILRGNSSDSRPLYIKKSAYIDFQNDMNFNEKFEELLRHIHKKPRYTRPLIGVVPTFLKKESDIVDENRVKEINTDYKEIYNFAYRSNGMNLSRVRAERFTKNWLAKAYDKDLEVYIKAYSFGYSGSGMNMSRAKGEEFAWKWIEEAYDKDFEVYKEAYSFGYSSSGMNLSRVKAEEFAWSQMLRKRK